MKILVIGKDGQLGKSIKNRTDSIKSHDFLFVGRSDFDMGNIENINNFFNRSTTFDIIVNCAAYTDVEKAEIEPDIANQINHIAVKELAEISNRKKIKFIHISTDYVFNGKSDKPYIETDTAKPINVYGETKFDAELAIKSVMNNNALIIRTSWMYSEYGNNFVKTMLKLGKEKEEVKVVSDQIGSPTYAGDLADAITTIIQSEKFNKETFQSEIFHYSNEGATSWFNFAKEIYRITGINCKITPISTNQFISKVNRPKMTAMDINKISNYFKIKLSPWKESLIKMYNLNPEIFKI